MQPQFSEAMTNIAACVTYLPSRKLGDTDGWSVRVIVPRHKFFSQKEPMPATGEGVKATLDRILHEDFTIGRFPDPQVVIEVLRFPGNTSPELASSLGKLYVSAGNVRVSQYL